MSGLAAPKFYSCAVCKKRTKPKERRTINKSIRKYLLKRLFVETIENDIICNKCRQKYYATETSPSSRKVVKEQSDRKIISSTSQSNKATSPPSVTLNIKTTSKTHSRCLVCKRPGPKLVVISSEARFNVFIEQNIMIPAGSRCCPVHMNEGILTSDSLKNVPVIESAFLNRTSILKLITHLREICCSKQNKLNFDSLNDSDYENLTGLQHAQFDDVFRHVADKLHNSTSRSARTSLGIFLLKLKSGLSNKLLSTLFGLSKSSVRRAIVATRHALMRGFVPLYIGLEIITRDDIINYHTRPLAKSLFNTKDGQIILVLDGTYIYIQKSNNFSFQRRSYSLHKGRPLVKPMVVVTTTGYFVTIMGPYYADSKNNDASILSHMLRTNTQEIKEFLQEDDVFIVDRGFRDSLSLLEDLGIRAEMPSFLSKGQKQMTCEDANNSRFVTKIRWVVESANARIKTWKYFNHTLPTNQIPCIGDNLRIVCALSNKYLQPLCSPERDDDTELASKMRALSVGTNALKTYIECNNLERRSTLWETVADISLDCFPRFSEEQLRCLTCGVYQLKLSPSYIQEHLDGNCDIQINKDEKDLIRVRIQSRHISARQYLLWIRFSDVDIVAWYCKCRTGERVVGMCSHVASVVWYLSYARHLQCQKYGIQNWGEYLVDASQIPNIIDESESDTDASCIEE